MAETLKIVIPMAGWGTRMRPHTWSKPKPLVSVAGKTSLEHVMDMFKTLPDPNNVEYIFIVSPHLGENQVPAFIKELYPDLTTHVVVQHEMKGQSHALALARDLLHGPMIVCFSDTLMETDFSFLAKEKADVVAWVMPVPDPRRFGVADVNAEGWVTRFIEKPETMENNLAVIGCYYFKSAEKLLEAVDEQIEREIILKGEYFLTDTITIMIDHGAKVRTEEISTWLDTGTIAATLETNKILLGKIGGNGPVFNGSDVKIIGPVLIHETAEISNSIIGPFVSIGANCRVTNAQITESIIESDCEIMDAALHHSLIGRQATVKGRGDRHVANLNVGDDSTVIM